MVGPNKGHKRKDSESGASDSVAKIRQERKLSIMERRLEFENTTETWQSWPFVRFVDMRTCLLT